MEFFNLIIIKDKSFIIMNLINEFIDLKGDLWEIANKNKKSWPVFN